MVKLMKLYLCMFVFESTSLLGHVPETINIITKKPQMASSSAYDSEKTATVLQKTKGKDALTISVSYDLCFVLSVQ